MIVLKSKEFPTRSLSATALPATSAEPSAGAIITLNDVSSGSGANLIITLDREARLQLIAELTQLEDEPYLFAVCEGGLIQDASPEIQTVDLDWIDSDGPYDLEEAERSYEVLSRVNSIPGHGGWKHYLKSIRSVLEALYEELDIPEEQKLWNQ